MTQLELGQPYTLRAYPREVWAAATVTLRAADGTDLVPSTAAAVSAVARTVASGARGSSTLVLAAGAGVIHAGRPYLLTGAGATQEVQVTRVDGLQVEIQDRLRYSAVGAVLADHAVSYSSLAAPATEQRAVRVLWRRTSTGEMIQETLDFVRTPFCLGLSIRDVDAIGGLFGALGDDYGVFELALQTAERDIDAWLRGRGIAPDSVIERALLQRAGAYRAVALRTRDQQLYSRYHEEYVHALADFAASGAWVDKDRDGVRDDGEVPPPNYVRVA